MTFSFVIVYLNIFLAHQLVHSLLETLLVQEGQLVHKMVLVHLGTVLKGSQCKLIKQQINSNGNFFSN